MSAQRTLSIHAKCSDMCFVVFPNGRERDGYVPRGVGVGGGDYIELEIDIDTGKILGWSDGVRDNILAAQDNVSE